MVLGAEGETVSNRWIVLCEKSGVMRRALRAVGIDAWSCDLEPAEDNSPHHIQTDSGQNRLGPSEDRSAKRAETYPGIANWIAASVAAWTDPLLQ